MLDLSILRRRPWLWAVMGIVGLIAPSQLVHSYAGIRRMAGDLRRVVELLDMGINPERLEVVTRARSRPG